MAIITTFPIAAETAGAPALLGQITLDYVIISVNPWNYMRAMFEPAPLMLTEDLHKTARIEAYNDRKQARIDGLKAAAASMTTEAKRKLDAGWRKLDAIPFGQPVHGAADRNYREKAGRQIDRGFEIANEATELEHRARAAEDNRAISSDDPMAVEKLTAKLDELQKLQEKMKSRNKVDRKAGEKPHYPAWALSNNNANIRRIKERIEEIQNRQERDPREWSGNGWTAETDLYDNRIRIYFEGKPDDETRSILKGHGFKWSPKAGAWQRQITRAAIWSMDRIAERLA